jgi:hypothetical protein
MHQGEQERCYQIQAFCKVVVVQQGIIVHMIIITFVRRCGLDVCVCVPIQMVFCKGNLAQQVDIIQNASKKMLLEMNGCHMIGI